MFSSTEPFGSSVTGAQRGLGARDLQLDCGLGRPVGCSSVSFKSDQPLYETEWTHMLTEPNENKSFPFFLTTREMRCHENMAFYSS